MKCSNSMNVFSSLRIWFSLRTVKHMYWFNTPILNKNRWGIGDTWRVAQGRSTDPLKKDTEWWSNLNEKDSATPPQLMYKISAIPLGDQRSRWCRWVCLSTWARDRRECWDRKPFRTYVNCQVRGGVVGTWPVGAGGGRCVRDGRAGRHRSRSGPTRTVTRSRWPASSTVHGRRPICWTWMANSAETTTQHTHKHIEKRRNHFRSTTLLADRPNGARWIPSVV